LEKFLEIAKKASQEIKISLKHQEESLEIIKPMIQRQSNLKKLFDSISEYKIKKMRQ
jgi:hypothetical protein